VKYFNDKNELINSIILLFTSLLIALIFTLGKSSTYSSIETCYTTAYSYATKFQYFLNNNTDLFPPSVLSSLDSFSLSQLIIVLFNNLNNESCYSTLLLRYLAHLFPLFAASIICIKVVRFRNTWEFIAISIPVLLSQKVFFKLFTGPPSFNYPFLVDSINYTPHMNGLLTNSFSLLLFTIVYLVQNKTIRTFAYLIGGLINPIIASIYALSYVVFNSIKKGRPIYTNQFIFEPLFPVLSYLFSKFIWINIFINSNIKYEQVTNAFDYQNYLNFINLIDSHRNVYLVPFERFFNDFSLSLNIVNSDSPIVLISLSYAFYVIICLILFLIIKFIFNKNIMIDSDKLIKRIIGLLNELLFPLLIGLVTILSIDWLMKLMSYINSSNTLNILVYYNQFYISRIISLLFSLLYFYIFSFIAVITFRKSYLMLAQTPASNEY
tara:strand:+ start:4988 stop:6298 length:1311 start_codon:yes stop_codon:yes gene_type:complete